jgi:hypothetical protein
MQQELLAQMVRPDQVTVEVQEVLEDKVMVQAVDHRVVQEPQAEELEETAEMEQSGIQLTDQVVVQVVVVVPIEMEVLVQEEQLGYMVQVAEVEVEELLVELDLEMVQQGELD